MFLCIPPYCICCGNHHQAHWSSDWDASDYGYECDGVIGLYICSNCGTHIEVRDLYINETEERSLKYYIPDYLDDDEIEEYEETTGEMDYCIYCSSTLETLETKPYKAHEDDGEGVLTIKKCNYCESIYEIEDIYPLEDIYRYPDDYLTPYDLRTIIIK